MEDENVLRPDGKVMMEVGGVKKIYLIEMTVTWTENREEKYNYKCNKYVDIQQNLIIEYPEYELAQITRVMDVFDGFSEKLGENLGKVINGKDAVKTIIKVMQKTIISSLANL